MMPDNAYFRAKVAQEKLIETSGIPYTKRADALFVSPDPFFATRRVQLANLASHHSIPATYSNRDYAEAGGLMSYGPNISDAFRQVGVYAGRTSLSAPSTLPHWHFDTRSQRSSIIPSSLPRAAS
jgi:uncharacterized protein YbjT (DUF2867 family)